MGNMNSIVTENSTLLEMKSFHIRRSGHSCIFSTFSNIFQNTSTYFNLSNIFQPFQHISTFPKYFNLSNIFQPFQHISTFPTFFNLSNIFQPFQHISTFFNFSNKFQHISKFFNIFKPFQHIPTCCDNYFVTFSLQLYMYRKIYDIKKKDLV